MAFRVAHWDMLDDILAFWYARGRYFEHTKCQVSRVYILVCKRQTCLRPLIASVIFVHFSELVNHYVT